MYCVLIIEDDASYLNMMEFILRMEGFDVRTASDGRLGLASLREKRPDLILCDIMMPDMDGHSLLETLKKNANFAAIPFVFVTALGDRADVRQGMAAGADDYLIKPFNSHELLAAILGRLRRHEMILNPHTNPAYQEERAFLHQMTSKREREVLLMVGHGITSREISERLGLAPKTIEAHRANLMRKLSAPNAAALSRWAVIAEQAERNSI